MPCPTEDGPRYLRFAGYLSLRIDTCFCLGSRWVLHFMSDYKSFVSFYLVPVRVQHMPFGAEVFSYDALHIKKALRVFG